MSEVPPSNKERAAWSEGSERERTSGYVEQSLFRLVGGEGVRQPLWRNVHTLFLPERLRTRTGKFEETDAWSHLCS